METITTSHSLRAFRMRERWPSCRAPIVGMRARLLRSSLAACTKVRMAEIWLKARIGCYSIGVFRSREIAVLYLLYKSNGPFTDGLANIGIPLCVLKRFLRIEPEQIVKHLHLPITMWTSADPNGR